MSSLPRISGVYKITCTPSGKVYIGSSKDIRQRWFDHTSKLRKNKHSNPHLQAAWNKYGVDNFLIEVVEEVLPDRCFERENWWIEHYQSHDRQHGYNVASTVSGGISSEEHLERIKQARSDPEWRRGQAENARRQWAEPGRREALGRKSYAMMADPVKGARVLAALNSPEAQEKSRLKQRGKKIAPHIIEAIKKAQAKEFIATDPDGNEYRFYNLTQFCKDHGLSHSAMHKSTISCKRTSQGWTCRRVNEQCH